jgi:hypothetical protein
MVSDITKVEVQLDFMHWLVHKGYLFFLDEVQTAATVQKYTVTTGATPLHYRVTIASGAKVGITILKDVTITVAGTALTPKRYNNAVTTTTLLSVFQKGATYTGGTSFKVNQSGFGSTPGQAQSGSIGQDIEYIIPANASWAIEIDPSVSTDIVSASTFYELALS